MSQPVRTLPRPFQQQPQQQHQQNIVPGGLPYSATLPHRSTAPHLPRNASMSEAHGSSPMLFNPAAQTPVAVGKPRDEYYGSANLTGRSRTPSPSPSPPPETALRKAGQPRKLPTMPQKPSVLNLSAKPCIVEDHMPHVLPSPVTHQAFRLPGSINFPRLNASPSHGPMAVTPDRDYATTTTTTTTSDQPSSWSQRSNLPRSVSSQQLGQIYGSMRDRDRHPGQRYPSQFLYPTTRVEDPRHHHEHGHHSHGASDRRHVAMEDFKGPAYSSSEQHAASTLPRIFKGDKYMPRRTGQYSSGSMTSLRHHQLKPKRPNDSDSEDEDWC